MFRIENPSFLLLLLLIPLVSFLRKTKIFARQSFPLTLSDWNGTTFGWNTGAHKALHVFSSFCVYAAFASLVCALSAPELSDTKKVYTQKGTEILFVIDTSPSMAALDMQGENRLTAAKNVIRSLTNQSEGSSFALVAMAEQAALVVPPTTDHALFCSRLDSLAIGELGDGTAIGTGLSSGVYHLASSTAPKKCIVLITDGENNAGAIHPDTAAKLAAQNRIRLYVVGIGTQGTVNVEYTDPKTGKKYSGYLESAFNEHELMRVARSGGGTYFTASDVSALNTVLQDITARERVVQAYRTERVTTPLFSYFLLASVVLVCVGFLVRRCYLGEFL